MQIFYAALLPFDPIAPASAQQ